MRRILYLIVIIINTLTSCDLAPGSYPNAEIYEFETTEVKLIEAVNKFKIHNPEYSLLNQERFKDGRRNKSDHWHHIWFYYHKDDEIVKCWIREGKIAFIGLGDGIKLSNYMEINKDFSRKENKYEKEKFERLILSEIKKNLIQTSNQFLAQTIKELNNTFENEEKR